MSAVGGAVWFVRVVDPARHSKGDTVGTGLGEGDGPTPGTSGLRPSGLTTSSTPTSITTITAAAMAPIHTEPGPRRSGASTRAERTRWWRAGSGDPLIESNASPISRRKSSRVISEHLLEG